VACKVMIAPLFIKKAITIACMTPQRHARCQRGHDRVEWLSSQNILLINEPLYFKILFKVHFFDLF
jgi:hypothetical protein